MTRKLIIAAAIIAAVGTVGGVATSGAATQRHFDATIISKSSATRTVKADVAHRGIMRFKVTSATVFERVTGFSGIRSGQQLEVTAKRSGGRWVALRVERSGKSVGKSKGGRGG